MEDLAIEIIPEDFKNAPNGYVHSSVGQGCVLWQALHRVYPNSYILVGFSSVRMDNKVYRIDNSVWGKDFMNPKDTLYHPNQINELSRQAKVNLEGIPTINLTLKQYGSP
jgi:hypothetical protein